MVDALASDRSDQPFGEAVLPRRAWSDGLVADAHGAQSVRDGSAIEAIPIADQVARRLSPRECFGDLACDPVRGRMGCDVLDCGAERGDIRWARRAGLPRGELQWHRTGVHLGFSSFR